MYSTPQRVLGSLYSFEFGCFKKYNDRFAGIAKQSLHDYLWRYIERDSFLQREKEKGGTVYYEREKASGSLPAI